MHTTKQTKGYSLVEVLVAISVLLIALVGPMTIAAKGIQSSVYVREQTIAISLAQEGIEAFIAARNDATIKAFSTGTLSTSWGWTTDGTIAAACKTTNGCNIDYRTSNPLGSTVATCGFEGSGCDLYFKSSSGRARYSLDNSGVLTPYRRAIRVSNTVSGTGLQITSTVYWNAGLFGGQTQSLTLIGEVYKLY